MADSGNGKVICAICYEEAKPACEELQSISLCGHVFHELCVQQWLEYCPRGRKSTCPLCKQQCTEKDVHRLYFQSSTEATQAAQESCSKLPCSGDDVETLRATVQKLTGQLSVAKSSLEMHQEQLQEANRQLSLCILRAERAESSLAEANKERSILKDAISRLQEELKRSTAERCKLLERNTHLTKELASSNLTQNLDVDEDEVARMARVGCGNKDDVITTLTRSLIVRNRAYKNLMAKCNELGTGENQALRKCEKAFERIKALKVRVQKLERCLEDKENGELRSLKASSSLFCNDHESPALATKRLVTGVALKAPLPLQPSAQTNQISDSSVEPFKVIRSSAHGLSRDSVGKTSEASEFVKPQGYSNKIDKNVSIADMEQCLDEFSKSPFPVTIRKEVRLSASTVSATGTSTSTRDNQSPNPSKWCKQSLACAESSSGTFISVGANGRGGQVKVLRPPPILKVGGVSNDNWLRSTKRIKSSRTGQHVGSQQGSLQIEHFFGGL